MTILARQSDGALTVLGLKSSEQGYTEAGTLRYRCLDRASVQPFLEKVVITAGGEVKKDRQNVTHTEYQPVSCPSVL